jgi:hypothetical protein
MPDRCTHHEFTAEDKARDYSPLIGSGPQCPNDATHVSCDPTGALHCAEHKCRCAKTIEQAAKDAADRELRRAKQALATWWLVDPWNRNALAVPLGPNNFGCNLFDRAIKEGPVALGLGDTEPAAVLDALKQDAEHRAKERER